MKLHLTDFWHHDPHPSPGLQTHSPLSSRASGLQPTKLQNTMYAAILVLGVPAVVGATMFIVRHLYDGLLWLLPS